MVLEKRIVSAASVKHAKNRNGYTVFLIDHDVVFPDDHFPRSVNSARLAHARLRPQSRNLVFYFCLQGHGCNRIISGDVRGNGDQVVLRYAFPFQLKHCAPVRQ
jgi:uncharacterized protein (DUF2461 family)